MIGPQKCGTCRFSNKLQHFNQYACRRHSPIGEIVHPIVDERLCIPKFPVMREIDWCGDWEWKDGR